MIKDFLHVVSLSVYAQPVRYNHISGELRMTIKTENTEWGKSVGNIVIPIYT